MPIRILGSLFRALDRVRRVLHFLLLLMIFMILAAGIAQEQIVVPQAAALVIAPQGALVDQLSGDPFERALARARGVRLQETLLKDLVDALRAAKDDDRIKAVVLELDGLSDAGLSKLQELADEIMLFKESGKPVFALADGFTRNQYYLAAHADHVFLHPMGIVLIDGYSRFLPYYKSALDKLYIDYNVWTVGEYKSFVEPITRDDMSPEDEEASLTYLRALWESYQSDVTAARGLPPDALQRYADELPELLAEAGGDTAALAASYGLVDDVLPHDLMQEKVRDAVGAVNHLGGEPYPAIDAERYLRAVRAERPEPEATSKIAVVVAAGTILDGVQPPGTVGGESMAQLIRQAGEDDSVKALVMRVDSPGGSAFASEVIRRELEVFRESGRPVVVSMGSVAASGGYWISMGADEIWASPTTLTGSIGVGAALPTFQRSLAWLGVNVDGVGTTELDGQFEITRELGPDARELLGQLVRHTYDQFIGKVAEHRDRSPEEIDRVARGRVWTGGQAYERGLVDRLGDTESAIRSAAELAGLEEGTYRVEYFERELTFMERLALELTTVAAPLVEAFAPESLLPAPLSQWVESAMEPLAFVERLNDPRGVYAYCFCDVR
ncbi:MAG TPA: signal peptide peptidase SppA [Gammaproteobacteria bacterium]